MAHIRQGIGKNLGVAHVYAHITTAALVRQGGNEGKHDSASMLYTCDEDFPAVETLAMLPKERGDANGLLGADAASESCAAVVHHGVRITHAEGLLVEAAGHSAMLGFG